MTGLDFAAFARMAEVLGYELEPLVVMWAQLESAICRTLNAAGEPPEDQEPPEAR